MSQGNQSAEVCTPPAPAEAHSLERAFLIDEHTAHTGWAESHWSYHHAEDRIRSNPIVIVGGYLGVEAAYFPVATELVKRGIDVITIDPPRAQRLDHALHPAHLLHPERLLAQVTCRVVKQAVDEYGDEKGFQQVDSAGHSMGGPGSVYAARRHPKLFNSVTLWGPAGASEHGIASLAARIPEVAGEAVEGRDRLRDNFEPRDALSFVKYIIANPLRTATEAIAVSRSDIQLDLKWLGHAGVKRAMMALKRDGFFKPNEIAARIAGYIDFWTELDLGHIAAQTHPNEVAQEQAEILDKIDSADSALAA